METVNLAMKRTNEKEGENELSSKKTKTEHPENSSQSSLIKPTRTKSLNKNVLDGLAGFKKKPVADIEPIVLSSDDEEEINMHKSALAKSLNVTAPTTASSSASSSKVEQREKGSGTVNTNPSSNKMATETSSDKKVVDKSSTESTTVPPVISASKSATSIIVPSAVQKSQRITPEVVQKPKTAATEAVQKSKPTTPEALQKVKPTTPEAVPKPKPTTPSVVQTSTPITPEAVQTSKNIVSTPAAPKPIAPATVTMSITVPTLSKQPPTEIIDDPIVEDSPLESVARVSEVTYLDSSDEEDEDEIEMEDKPEEITKEQDATVETSSVSDTVENPNSPSNTAPTDNMSEVDELLSDSDPEGETTDVNTTTNATVELLEVEKKDASDSDNAGQRTRPVRQTNSRVTTYNDIANSVDPNTLTYNSSSDDEPHTITALAPKKPKKRPSPPKLARPAAILNAFTRDLTDRRHLKTGFVYDTAMSYHATPNPMEIHPEDPRRIFKIFNILDKHGLLRECERINSRRATKQEILLAHNIIHYRKMRETAGKFNF